MGFLDLPQKARLRIYDLLNEPRVVELSFDERLSSFWSTTPPPVGLSITRESRHATQANYVLSFPGTTSPGKVWFDFKRDTLYIGTSPHPISSYPHHARTSLSHQETHRHPPGKPSGNRTRMPLMAARAAVHLAMRDGGQVQHLALHASLFDAIIQQLFDDMSFFLNEGVDMGLARVLVLPAFTNLTTLAIAGHVSQLDPETYETLCERVGAQHAGDWRVPRIDYLLEELEEDGNGVGGGGGGPAGNAGAMVPLAGGGRWR